MQSEIRSIDSIIRLTRVRQDLGDLTPLVKSIQETGIIQPIIINFGGTLLAGERRLEAAKLAGLTEVPVLVRADAFTAAKMKEIELHENLGRKDFHPTEESFAIEELHRLREVQADVEGVKHTQRDTAQELGRPESAITLDRQVVQAVRAMPDLADLDNKASIVAKFRQRMIHTLLAEKARRAGTIAKNSVRLGEYPAALKDIPDESVDLLLTSPPFGVDLPNSQMAQRAQASVVESTGYSDEFQPILDMILSGLSDIFRIMASGTHIYMFCGSEQMHYIRVGLRQEGFIVDPVPLLWIKPSGANLRPSERWTHPYEFCIWGYKPPVRPFNKDGPIGRFDYAPEYGEKLHIAQMPIGILQDMINLSSHPGNLVLDPFCGGGSTLVAAIKLGRKALGIDVNPECVALSTAAVEMAMVPQENSENESF